MKLKSIEVDNFRSLENACIEIDVETTLIVGRNNSGKTSLLDLMHKFFIPENVQFELEDLSISRLTDLEDAVELFDQAENHRAQKDLEGADALETKALAKIPAIRLRLNIEYDDDDDLSAISEIILNLNEARYDAQILATVSMEKPLDFFRKYSLERKSADISLVKYLRSRFNTVYLPRYYAVDPEDPKNSIALARSIVQRVVSAQFIYAQNKLDDASGDNTGNLSKTFQSYYSLNGSGDPTAAQIESALTEISTELDQKYEELFAPIFDDLRQFGVNTIAPMQKLKVIAQLEPGKILAGNTKLFYESGQEGYLLPEGHNGLGYAKLIFTVLQVVGFYETYKKARPQPALQVLFLEEPEAHLHPQMQEVFIRNIRYFIAQKTGWHVQIVMTTHSSHIVASSEFSSIRYFDRSSGKVQVRDLSTFSSRLGASAEETIDFLRQYMQVHRCDIFFADKAILVEGTVERLLLPLMIQRCAPTLEHEYVSVIEVGGAYAVKFKQLLDFVNVRTLVVTDIDSVLPKSPYSACRTDTADARTSNKTLREWLPREILISDLLGCDDKKKASDRVRVAFQIQEEVGSPIGRSFEEAFILRNAKVIHENIDRLTAKRAFYNDQGNLYDPGEIVSHSYEIAAAIPKKTDFAHDILRLEGWNTPRYLQEGLAWLNEIPC